MQKRKMNSGQPLTITNREREWNKGLPLLGIRDLMKLGRQRQRKRQKRNRFNGQSNNSPRESLTLFCQFLCRPCTTATSLVKWPNLKSS